MEIRRKGKSYTVDTLRSLSSPDVQLVMLCGSDMLLTLSDWYRAEQILQMTEIVYLNRAQDDVRQTERAAERLRREYGAVVHQLVGDIIEIASHSVREMRLGGLPWRDALPPPVAEYIERKGLYL
jgi:nicotinate-nucleotide adenylyltransferase